MHSVAGPERQGLALDGFWPVTDTCPTQIFELGAKDHAHVHSATEGSCRERQIKNSGGVYETQ